MAGQARWVWPDSTCSEPAKMIKCLSCRTPRLLFDNYIYVAIGTSFCVPSGKWGGAMTGSQGGDEPAARAIHVDPLTRLWQARRDNGTDHNGTFSRPLTDWKGSSWSVRKFWQNGGTIGAMMR